MAKHDMPQFHPHDLAAALGLLSRLPVRVNTTLATERGAHAAWAWPLAGLIIGAIVGGLAVSLVWLGLPVPLAALSALTVQTLITGALHEDGLADCADGFWGGYEPARRLEIMKDSRIGAYGVIAIVLSLTARAVALMAVLSAPFAVLTFMAIGMISRTPMVVLMRTLPNARGRGLAQSVGVPPLPAVSIALMLSAVLGGALLGFSVLPVLICTGLSTLALAFLAREKIGGQTGDVLGASQQLAEISALFTLASLIG